ncbi:unnamed protein product [Caenorhabditis angaria]|uniref:Uncharacterized protein n=1 Tax=Caenorhabditis angaria TaxID=860376 RepID=A0A9P1J0B0_9PELO|nr:unnamed protein product [Caenorhabditis angaria]
MVFPQVPKDPPKDKETQKEKEAHAKRLHSQANIHQHVQHGQHSQQPVLVSPLVVSHYAQNVCTELQLGLAPPTSGGGGFFASGLFRTRQPSRPRAYSMLPLTNSTSQEEVFQDSGQKSQNSLNPKKHSNRSYKQRYYPLSQEDTLELLLLLNQVFIASDVDIMRRVATATRGVCPPPPTPTQRLHHRRSRENHRHYSRSVCEQLFDSSICSMAPINVSRSHHQSINRRYSTLVSVSERVVLRADLIYCLTTQPLINSLKSTVFVSWALRSVRESLIQVDPLAAALAHQARKANSTVPSVSRTPLLLQFTPFGPPPGAFSAHLMDERRSSYRRRSTFVPSIDSPHHSHSHHNFLIPPPTVNWVGTQIIADFHPVTIDPAENPIGWAIFNPLPIKAPALRPRLRQIQVTPGILYCDLPID